MDPRYRPFYQHVWAFCWPILWWNLMRLAAVQRKVKRTIWVTVTRTGQIRVRYIADAPVRRVLPEWSARWERPSLASDLPACLAALLPCPSRLAVDASWAGHAKGERPLPGAARIARAPP